jgi:hypothetical protein
VLLLGIAFVDGVGALWISRPVLYTPATNPWWSEMKVHHDIRVDLSREGLSRDLNPPPALGTYPNNRNVALKRPIFNSYITLWNRFQQQMVNDPRLSRMALGPDRIWFSPSADRRAPDNASFERFAARVRESERPILVLHSPEQMLALAPAPGIDTPPAESLAPLTAAASVPAKVLDLHYLSDSLSFRYDAPGNGYLLVTDRWAPGWEASVNGRKSPVWGADFIFRAVEVASGSNVVEFRFRPHGYWALVFLSWGALALFASCECWRFGRRRWRLHSQTKQPILP